MGWCASVRNLLLENLKSIISGFGTRRTRIMSRDSPPLRFHSSDCKTERYHVNCESGTYKVVAMLWDVKSRKREVKVCSIGETL